MRHFPAERRRVSGQGPGSDENLIAGPRRLGGRPSLGRRQRQGGAVSETAGVEMRIHGIGNHGPLSALGSPLRGDLTVLDRRSNDPAVVRPELPAHDVWFVAWTRSSRAINSLAWYLGLPFTLCNTAGHMRSRGWLGSVTAAYT